jgi:hypothetical protein
VHIDNEGEALTTMHIVIDSPEDQVYVTYQGVTFSIYLSDDIPERAFFPKPIVLDVMCEDDLTLTHTGNYHDGDGLRVCVDGKVQDSYDRTYSKEN